MAQAKLFSFTIRSEVKTQCDVKKIMTVVFTSLLLVGLYRSLVHLWVQAYLCTKSVPKKDSSGFIKIFPEIFFFLSEEKVFWESKKALLHAMFYYIRVSFNRGVFSNNKEGVWQGIFFPFISCDVSLIRVYYRRGALYIYIYMSCAIGPIAY